MRLLWCAVYIAAAGVLSHVVGERLPRSWFHADRFPYASAAWERGGRAYEALGIQRWKRIAPDMSRLMKDMTPKRLNGAPSSEEVERLVQETCVAESVHVSLCVLGLAFPLLWPEGGVWVMLLYILLGNLPFILIQRYNRPRLAALAARRKRQEEKRKHEGSGAVL